MQKQSEANKAAWSYRAYEFWIDRCGLPSDKAKELKEDPKKPLRRHLEYIGDVKGKKVANLLGSNGRKAVPLALLGADMTVIDISEENKRYAMELAKEAGVDINFIVADLMELDTSDMNNCFDIVYMEEGILHYFTDLNALARKIYEMTQMGGKLVLIDFHPFKNILNIRDIYAWDGRELKIEGNYFDKEMVHGDVAYKKYFDEKEQGDFPDCLLRFWTIGDIISAFASAGFVIEKLAELPRDSSFPNIPALFALIAHKYKVEKAE